MKQSKFYKKLKPAYEKWLSKMDKEDVICNAFNVAFVKEIMYYMDLHGDDPDGVKVPDDMDPDWFIERTSDTADESPVGEMFVPDNGVASDFFTGFMEQMRIDWNEWKREGDENA